jgi:hypothetical protein
VARVEGASGGTQRWSPWQDGSGLVFMPEDVVRVGRACARMDADVVREQKATGFLPPPGAGVE